MIDYTYWQYRLRGHLKNDEITYRPVKIERAANFLIGVQEMNQSKEEILAQILEEHQAAEDRTLRWLFYPQGEIVLSKNLNLLDEDSLMLIGLANGSKEVYFDEHDLVYMFCSPEKLEEMSEILALEGAVISHALQSYRSQGVVEIYQKETAKKVYDFCQRLCEEDFIVDLCADFAVDEVWIEDFERQ